ncbi:telomere length regulation protein-domain-containing protein [Desarmillaria tabescens]|uniref:Telomere length regulation protein-domain-containing protein n=1 Tax=Armillaria tabescens TaxID=1929756 RepID=A0AA39KEZ1_ARMTA|nr:telomere length regulation protein-domain-containing protein [Desarmillaria tabescens]KAK0459518.1 telomere length regulation protein-domain-containing protein [Desarmillaria tabescens]
MDNTLGTRDVVKQLRLPVGDITTLLALLSGPLDCLGLLPPSLRKYNVNPLPDDATQVLRHISTIQQAILQHIFPTWETALAGISATSILEQYFCPDSFSYALSSSGDVALSAYSTILSVPLSGYSIRLLERLTKEYPVDRLHRATFSGNGTSKKDVLWEDCVRNIAAVPAKVANSAGTNSIPSSLEQGNYFTSLSVRCEALISSLAANAEHESGVVSSVVYLLVKMVNLGLLPSSPPTLPSQASFFLATLPIIRNRLDGGASENYSKIWAEVFLGFPSIALQTVLTSLFASLRRLDAPLDGSAYQRAWVKREALLLDRLVGRLSPDNEELCETAIPVILGRNWDESCARIFVCWVAGPQTHDIDENALGHFLQEIVAVWSSPDHVKHSLLARHQYFTALLVLTVAYFKRNSPEVSGLAQGGSFISGVSLYIGHMDPSIRRCGMLAAEVVAGAAGKKLNFDDWEGAGDGKPWARALRDLLRERAVDFNTSVLEQEEPLPTKETEKLSGASSIHEESPGHSPVLRSNAGYDSDDSLTGYASPASSRSASPTPSELDDIEKDPTLNVTKKKLSRPVYLVQLGELLRSSGVQQSDAALEADRIEMALSCSEGLIRKKQFFGTELEENAANLAYGLIALNNTYNLENFDARRQNALVALVACCPRKTAPCLVDEFFKNQYNVGQRYVMLNALALGARETSGLAHAPLPQFPSKLLPASLHRKYITSRGPETSILPAIMGDLTRQAIQSSKDNVGESAPTLVRERRLRIQKPQMVSEIRRPERLNEPAQRNAVKFTEVAAEFFVGPLVNRFWLFLRDEQMREERTAHLKGRQAYYGAGTGLILNSLVLSYFLSTLGVLLHASRNAPEWSAVLGPDALELAVNIGTRPVSRIEDEGEFDGGEGTRNQEGGGPMQREASVLQSALELALVILEGYQELDEGKSLCLEHTALLFGVGEWAGAVFSRLDKGERVQGGGGASETGLQRAAAGVLLKADNITSKWRRSMINTI